MTVFAGSLDKTTTKPSQNEAAVPLPSAVSFVYGDCQSCTSSSVTGRFSRAASWLGAGEFIGLARIGG